MSRSSLKDALVPYNLANLKRNNAQDNASKENNKRSVWRKSTTTWEGRR